jgi:7-keto-8-aminopelargonate synthetase-like enzyme
MGQAARALSAIDSAVTEAVARGLCQLRAEDAVLDGRTIEIAGRPALNFSSCSYLGLELDPRVRAGAIDAIERYGTQFSSSRTYVSAPLYEELESLLDQITGGCALATPSTSLGHLAALPVLIGEDDAAILDHQVHHSVQMAVPHLRQQGTHVEILRHDRVELLEERIRKLRVDHRRIWYLADGIYSMYGDRAPLASLEYLRMRYEELHLYIDDAHGMSWCGQHGRGYALDSFKDRERVVVAVSLNKAFAAAGGAIVFPNEELRRRVRTCGGPMIFSGPIQPPMLGAALASARIHLSDELPALQAQLMERVRHTNRRARELALPLVSPSEVPIRFVGVARRQAAYAMTERLIASGFFASIATFPAVNARCSGVRFSITRHHRLEDIDALLEAMAEHLDPVLEATGGSRREIDRVFGLNHSARADAAARAVGGGSALSCAHHDSIREIDREEWNALLGGRGNFDWEALVLLEEAFGDEQKLENRWRFHYYIVRDGSGVPVLATFFSEALWKDDLAATPAVSKAVEAKRRSDPYFLSSRVLGMGSLLSEGDHLYLDRDGPWQDALILLLEAVTLTCEESQVELVALRDLQPDEALDTCLRDAGFAPIDAPDSMTLELDWKDWESHLASLSYRARRFQRRVVAPLDESYAVEILGLEGRAPELDELKHIYSLYAGVKARSFEINTFALPEDFFARAVRAPGWEIFTLTLRPECGGEVDAPPQAMLTAYVAGDSYVPVVPGLDYRFVEERGAYRQCIRQVIRRAGELGCKRVLFGMGARFEKERFGAVAQERKIYVRSNGSYGHDVLSMIASDAHLAGE